MSTLADELAKGAGRFHKWGETPGVTLTGTILSADLRQSTKFGTTDPDTWDNGDPKMQAVLTLATDQRDPADPDDDGTRRIAINMWSGQKQALIKACRDAGVKEPAAGQGFTATWKSGVGSAASPRVFEYRITAAASGLGDALTGSDPTADPIGTQAAAAAKPLGEQAKEFLAQGLDVATVADMTGLPAATVAALANTLGGPPF